MLKPKSSFRNSRNGHSNLYFNILKLRIRENGHNLRITLYNTWFIPLLTNLFKFCETSYFRILLKQTSEARNQFRTNALLFDSFFIAKFSR